eukprot:351593-Chlamydomonas_euryale.AAC.3
MATAAALPVASEDSMGAESHAWKLPWARSCMHGSFQEGGWRMACSVRGVQDVNEAPTHPRHCRTMPS